MTVVLLIAALEMVVAVGWGKFPASRQQIPSSGYNGNCGITYWNF
jgi:hypothetical protein